MQIYQGPHLSITHEKKHKRLVQFWTHSPQNIEAFKSEMLAYISLFKKHKPQQVMWLQENMTVFIDDDAKAWIEEYINIPAFEENCLILDEANYHPVAFVVGKDVLTHLEVVGVFNGETKSCILPKHFASEIEARDWLNKLPTESKAPLISEVTLKGTDENGNTVIEIKSASSDIEQTLRTIKDIVRENEFMKSNFNLYVLLTRREKEILKKYARGTTHQEIADEIHVSLHTVRTHWRNVKRKLAVNSNGEAFLFAKAFSD